MTHNITVSDTDNPKYPLLLTCSCNFQCHCRTEEEADFRKRQHLSSSMWIEASKGYQVGH